VIEGLLNRIINFLNYRRPYETTVEFIESNQDAYPISGRINITYVNKGTNNCTILQGLVLEPDDEFIDSEPNKGGIRIGSVAIKFEGGKGRLMMINHMDRTLEQMKDC